MSNTNIKDIRGECHSRYYGNVFPILLQDTFSGLDFTQNPVFCNHLSKLLKFFDRQISLACLSNILYYNSSVLKCANRTDNPIHPISKDNWLSWIGVCNILKTLVKQGLVEEKMIASWHLANRFWYRLK
jgi:hypothetical protein